MAELHDVEKQILKLENLRSFLRRGIMELQFSLERPKMKPMISKEISSSSIINRFKDYSKTDFEWSKEIKALAKDVWKITSFRYAQEAAINASLDGRDLLCVMPTG